MTFTIAPRQDGSHDACRSAESAPSPYSRFEKFKSFFRLRRSAPRMQSVIVDSKKHWKPFTLKTPFLAVVALVTGSLICTVQVLLLRSQRNGGIIFDSDVNGLPIGQSFSYLYLPTLIAVIYSLIWSWIDLDTKRSEPYYQLSKEDGASAGDSLLLHYPFDFIASVPFKAIRRRHWAVFFASFGMVLIFWGLTPSQAGIFATETIERSFPVTTLQSTAYLPLEQQQTELTALYAQSVFNIAWLNETLPAFMTRDYVLAPFGLQSDTASSENSERWTGRTARYSVDVTCEEAIRTENSYQSSNGCDYFIPKTFVNGGDAEFATLYVGYHNENGFADYYLSQDCPVEASHTFLIRWSRGVSDEGFPVEETTLYCESTYYRQEVIATVTRPEMSVVNVTPVESPVPLPTDLFNTTDFEWGMNSGLQKFQNRGEYPLSRWPDHRPRVKDMNLDLNYLPVMASFAIAAYQRPSEDYFDPVLLQESYQAAYRLLFSRRLVDILGSDLDPETATMGERRFVTQAVLVVPAFAYLVEGLLGTALFIAVTLLCISLSRKSKLSSDPSSVAATMSLVAENGDLLNEFAHFDKYSLKELEQSIEGNHYRLILKDGAQQLQPCRIGASSNPSHQLIGLNERLRGDRPVEFRLWVGAIFLCFQSAIFILLAVLYSNAVRDNGLPLPSSNRFVRQLVQNYIPTAIATFMEPLWVVLNRLLCMLQPFEVLRRGNATARESLTLNYMSLPPQLFIWRAFKARHFILASVCQMALLGNVLAIAFSGLFFEAPAAAPRSAMFASPLGLPIDARPLTANASTRALFDHFYVAMSNLTAGTPMPSFTDDRLFYLPFNLSGSVNQSVLYEATTQAVGAQLDCIELLSEGTNSFTLALASNGRAANFTFDIAEDAGRPACVADVQKKFSDSGDLNGLVAIEMVMTNLSTTDTMTSCQEYIVMGWLRADITLTPGITAEKDRAAINSLDSTFLACHSRVSTGTSKITIDTMGRIQSASELDNVNDSAESWFTPDPFDFVARMNAHLSPSTQDTWHNDSFPSDFYNYLIVEMTNSSRLLDPSLPVPSAAEAGSAISALYPKLFAIVLGTNYESMLSRIEDSRTVPGAIIEETTRIFVSLPMFILSEVILGLYIAVSITLYVKRPWKFLPQMPASIASNIAFFAASRAVLDLKGTAGLSTRERNEYLEGLGHRYRYGSFIGTDGKPRVGIEKEPFVEGLSKEILEQNGMANAMRRRKAWWTKWK